MRQRAAFWFGSASLAWERVVALKDHVELATLLGLGLLAFIGISIRSGPPWLIPSVIVLLLVILTIDSAYVRWHAAHAGVGEPPAPSRVPRNRDQVVEAIHALERRIIETIWVVKELRDAGCDLREDTPPELDVVLDGLDREREQLLLAERIAGTGFVFWMRFHASDMEDYMHSAMFDADPDYDDLVDQASACTNRFLRGLDRGQLFNASEQDWDKSFSSSTK